MQDTIRLDITDNVLCAQTKDRISKIIGQMIIQRSTDVLIFKGVQLFGKLNVRRLLRSRVDLAEAQASGFTDPTPHLKATDDLTKAVNMLASENRYSIPIINGHYAGSIRFIDILKENQEQLPKNMINYQTKLFTIQAGSRLGTAIERIRLEHALPLVIVDNGNTIGVVTTLSLLRRYYLNIHKRDAGLKHGSKTKAFHAEREDILALPIEDFIERETPVFIDQFATTSTLIDLLGESPDGLIMMDSGVPTGIITQQILLSQLMSEKSDSNIEYRGLDSLPISEFTKHEIQNIIERHSKSIPHKVHNTFRLIVPFKLYSKTGGRHKYSVHARLHYAGGTITASHALDWNVKRAVHQAMQDIQAQLEHKYKTQKATSRKGVTEPPFSESIGI